MKIMKKSPVMKLSLYCKVHFLGVLIVHEDMKVSCMLPHLLLAFSFFVWKEKYDVINGWQLPKVIDDEREGFFRNYCTDCMTDDEALSSSLFPLKSLFLEPTVMLLLCNS